MTLNADVLDIVKTSKNIFKNSSINNAFYRNEIQKEYNDLVSNLDPDSVKIVDEYLDSLSCMFFLDKKGFFNNYFISNLDKLLYSDKTVEVDELLRLKKKFYYPFSQSCLIESFCCHHGLRFASDKVKDYITNKVFIDAGAYFGDSSLVSLEYNPKLIHAFDISRRNISVFKDVIKRNHIEDEKIKIFEKGLSNKDELVKLKDIGGYGQTLPEYSTDDGKGETYDVKITTLDEHISENQEGEIGFIKADIEGAGFCMVEGMVETLKKDRPVMSLSIYHNFDEFFKIKPFIESLNLDYHFDIIRTTRCYFSDIVLFATPNELIGEDGKGTYSLF